MTFFLRNKQIFFAIPLFFWLFMGIFLNPVNGCASPLPDWTQEPAVDVTPEPTDEPALEMEASPEPTVKPLKKVTGVTAVRYATDKVKIVWKKHSEAKYYKVYYAKEKNGKYRYAGVTKKQHFLVRHLKKNTKYYFYVKACPKKKASDRDSNPSKKVTLRTKKYSRKTIFAGDSICEGIAGGTVPYLRIGGKKKVVAYRGLNTVTYHTKRIFGGKTGLQKLIEEKPYRVYMMLGINEIHYQRAGVMIEEYEGMIQALKQASPDTDIVLCAVSPVTGRESARRKGFKQIPAFNKKLKKMAKKNGVTYLDYTKFLKNSAGHLREDYAQKDGYHWKPNVYKKFAKVIQKYDLSLDR